MRSIPASSQAIDEALAVLQSGGIVAHATETCYGLACDLTNVRAVERIFTVKERPYTSPVNALFHSVEATEEWVEWTEEARALAAAHLPGPLTIILPLRPQRAGSIFPSPSPSPSPMLGIRISPHPIAMELSKRYPKPISTTSANRTSLAEGYSVAEILEQFAGRKAQPDLCIDSGILEFQPPSTIVTFERGTMEIVRQGSVCLELEP
ncbi:threonylcarbamoyl-AMP synthase [Candidatus Peregrinibacteria bacterium CG10_big_fil_rev_8_21_14_0_10_55_24]|nr:MAG: threonylcarbamoyl-AMP synthase [Candidatus Peregrinibacteria bacterium CG10_big_fil_rev_8_21_14_0_10_55_24]